MMDKYRWIFLSLFCVASMGAVALWRFDAASRLELEQSIRQYGQLQTQLARYELLRGESAVQGAGAPQNLFSLVNQLGADLGLSRRIEALRPAVDKEMEILDFQIRALYLGEFARFIEGVEAIGNIKIERLSLTRPASMLLDLEMRISRRLPGKNS